MKLIIIVNKILIVSIVVQFKIYYYIINIFKLTVSHMIMNLPDGTVATCTRVDRHFPVT